MSAREVATWHPIPSALTLSPLHFHRSPLVSAAPDKVDRLEARTALLLAEPAARPEAAVAAPGAQLEAVVAAAEPGVQQAAVVAAAEPGAQQEAAAVAAVEPIAQQEVVVVVESVAQQQAAAMQWGGGRPLVFAATAVVGPQRAAWGSPMATMARQILAAAVRFWFLETSSLVRAPE